MPVLTAIWGAVTGFSSTTYIILGLSILVSIGALWFHNTENKLRQDAAANTALQISVDSQAVALAQAATDTATIQAIDATLSTLQQANNEQSLVLFDALTKLDAAAIL